MPTCISDLPWDIVSYIVGYLNVGEYVCLSSTSRRVFKDLQDEGSARKCIQQHLAFSQDGKEGFPKARIRGCRKRLSEVFDTSEALRKAQPYSASILAYATSFAYEQGIVCYSTDADIRILNLRAGRETEKVISGKFFSQKVAEAGETASSPALQPRSISIFSCRHNILTLQCDFGAAKGCYLFAIDVADTTDRQRCLLKYRLRSTSKLFACHNTRYLYYGAQAAIGSHGHHEWLVQGFDLSTGEKITDMPIQLYSFAGSDLGNSVAFTIHEDHFYALSNQTAHESEEVNWTSYYHYIRFPLDSKDPDLEIRTIYRRQDNEGPINDVWTDLGFQIDHATGELLVAECRKEWHGGGSSAVRTYYIEPWERAYHGTWAGANTVNPNDPVRLTVTEKDKARYQTAPRPRVDKYVHAEFSAGNSGARREYLRAKTKWNGYDFNNQCYVDLVVDEVSDERSWRKKERIRLRVVSRRPDSPLQRDGTFEETTRKMTYLIRPKITDIDEDLVQDSEDAFTESEVFLWPRDGMEVPRELDEILCPGGKAGDIKASVGEEGLVYMAGPTGQHGGQGQGRERALVFLGFEPNWGWEGLKRLNGEAARPRKKNQQGEQPIANDIGLKRKACTQGQGDEVKRHKCEDTAAAEQKTLLSSTPPPSNSTSKQTSATGSARERLLWMEKAKYLSIGKGYWLRTPTMPSYAMDLDH